MQCLNVKNKEVAALLDQYTDILGSYDAAYYVLSENNGYGLDKAPNGEPSKLYNDLLSIYNNDHSMAIRAKSMVYSDSFKNWFGDWIKVASSTEAAHKLTSYLNDLVNRKNRFSKLAKTLLDNGAIPYNLKYFKIDNNREDIEGHAGMWNSFANLIEVLGNNINQESIDKSLLHELIHYNTEQLLQDYKNNKEIPADQKEAIKRLYDIIEYSKNYLSKELQTNRDKYLEIARRQSNTVSSRLFYAFDNTGSVEIDEFISEIFTNPGLQEVLNNIPYKKSKQSLWDKIKNAISSIFGFDINDGSVLEEALKESSKLIQNNSNVSKVVDNNGEPLIVYHTVSGDVVLQGQADFTVFDPNYESNKNYNSSFLYFTDNKLMSESYFDNNRVWKNIGEVQKEIDRYDELLTKLIPKASRSSYELVEDFAKMFNMSVDEYIKDAGFNTFEDFLKQNSRHYTHEGIIEQINEIKERIKFLTNIKNNPNLLIPTRAFFINERNPFIVDAKGHYWNELSISNQNVDDIINKKEEADNYRKQLEEEAMNKILNEDMVAVLDYEELLEMLPTEVLDDITEKVNKKYSNIEDLESTRSIENKIKDNNEYDGTLIKNVKDWGSFNGFKHNWNEIKQTGTVVAVKNPNQIKSINNQGTFSTTDNNIYNQQSNSQTGTGRNQELASILQELYPNISIESLSNPNLRGQAQVEGYMAGKVLLNSLLENQDTLPHEYAHHYIAWFRNSNIVQKGIKLFGSEEQLVQAIGENSVKATKWYNRFFNWIKGLFNDKQKTLNSLTKSFLSGENIGNGKEVSNEIHNQAIDTINKQYDKLIKATKNRINLFTHSTHKIQQNLERLNNLYNNLNRLENDKAVIEFTRYMVDDVNQAMNQVLNYQDQFNDYKNNGGVFNPVTSDKLDIIKKGTIGFYNNLIVNLRNMIDDPEVEQMYKSVGAYNSIKSQLVNALSKYNELVREYNKLSDAVAKDNIIKEASRQGSFSLEELINKLDEGDQDLNRWDTYFGQTQYSNSELVRLMLNKMVQAKLTVHDKKLEVGKRLLTLLDKVSKSSLKLLYERDKKGKRTGNLVRDLNYGQWEQDYVNHMIEFAGKLDVKIPSDMDFSDIPSLLNPDQLKKWNREKNKWDATHTERRFTSDFYDLLEGLSQEAVAKKTQIDSDIRSILASTIDDEGNSHRENLSDEDYIKLVSLESAKRNLSNKFNLDGTIKTGKDLEIANEFAEYNKKLRDNIKYISNREAWETARLKAKRTLSKDKYELWLKRNSIDKPNELFYEDLSRLSSGKAKSSKQIKYEEYRQQLLKLYTIDNKVDVDSMPKNVKDLITNLDYLILREIEVNTSKGKKSRIGEIAKWEINPAFYKAQEAAKAAGREKEFLDENGFYTKRGKYIPSSYWKKLVPKEEVRYKYIETVPNSSWVEIDKTSPFYNKNFNERSEEFRQPKRSLYDNTANYNKVKGDLKNLYDELVNVMSESNSKLPFLTYSRNYRLPQIEGGAMTQILSQDNVLKGLGYSFKDTFTIKDDDTQYNVDKALDPDGSRIRLVPTRYMRKLDNPEALTNDIVGSVIAYYGMATNYQEMSSIAPEMELIVDYISRAEFNSSKGRIAGIKSNTYYKANQILEQFVYGMEENDMTIQTKINGKVVKFSVAKAINNLARFTRLNGMGNNLSVILTGLFTNKIQSRLDAISGIYYDNSALNKASREVQSAYMSALANIGSANNKNKVLCFLEWTGTVRNSEETFSKLNQSRWLRALNMHYWWGGYEAADFITKGKMAVAIAFMYKYDPTIGKFIHKNKFMLRYKNKKQGEIEWNRLTDTAFDAFEVKGNKFVIKPEYADKLDKITADRIRNTIKQVGTRIDTQFTDLDRSFINSNAFCKLIFIYRNFLLINFQTKFATKRHYDYSTGMWQEAQYRGAFNYLWRHYIDRNKINTLKEMYKNYDELDDFERRLAKRVLYETAFSLVGLFIISSFAKAEADDDEDDWLKNFIALISVRTAVESRSNLLPVETVNMFNSPTAAWGIIEHFGKALNTMFNEPNKIVDRGAYKGKTRFERSLIKITPFRSIYELKDPRSKLEYYDNLVSVF